MQHFSRAQCVENLDVEPVFEAPEQRSRKRFSGRNCVPNAGKIKVTTFSSVGQQGGVVRWNRIEERGPVALDISVYDSWRGAGRRKNVAGADREGEITCVAEPVSEEQLGYAVAAVPFVDSQDAPSIALCCANH